jgi:spore maturation protein SpmA
VKISDNVRTVVDVLAIIALWFGVLVIVALSGLGDCFTPGCSEAIDRRMHIELALTAIGFVSHIGGYFWLKARRVRRN